MADYDANRDQHDRNTDSDSDRFRPDENPRVAALSDLHDFEVAENYPDPRGWRVLTADGTEVGKVHDLIVDTGSMRTRYLDVKLDHDHVASAGHNDDWDVLIPIGSAQLAENDDEVLLPSLSVAQLASLPVYEHGEISRDYENSVLTGVGGVAAGAAAEGANRDYYDRQHFDDHRFFGRQQAPADLNAGANSVDAGNTGDSASTASQSGGGSITRRPVVREEIVVTRYAVDERNGGTEPSQDLGSSNNRSNSNNTNSADSSTRDSGEARNP